MIVPAYNCEKYIAKALDSLINQDLPQRNYEIIITDDGSTDSTGTICDTYAAKYPFIHVTHTANFGPSHARNTALPQCRGEYITFCDADDFVSPYLISTLSSIIGKYSPDLITWRFFRDEEFPAEGWPFYPEPSGSFADEEELCYRILLDGTVGGFSHTKALRREVIGDIRFDDSLSYCEDVDWFVRLCCRKKLKVFFTDCRLYCYVQHENFGQTRNPKNYLTPGGFPLILFAMEKIRDMPGLTPRCARMVRKTIYAASVGTLFRNKITPSREVYSKLRSCIRRYAVFYYLSPASLREKAKMLVKHLLILLHIHKPAR